MAALGMRKTVRRIWEGVLNVHARGRTVTRIAVAASIPALVAGQSLVGAAAPASAAVTAAPAVSAAFAATQPMTAALAARLSKNASQHVIVIMKSQLAAARVGSSAQSARSAVIASDQAPVMSELRAVHATHLQSYKLVNALSATVSKGEAARLKANPAVKEVIPDVMIEGASPEQAAAAAAASPSRRRPRRPTPAPR